MHVAGYVLRRPRRRRGRDHADQRHRRRRPPGPGIDHRHDDPHAAHAARANSLPRQIVSLMQYPGAPSTLARPDHGDYIEIDFPPAPRTCTLSHPPRAPRPRTRPAPARPRPRRCGRRRTERGAVGPADRAHRRAAGADRGGQAELLGDPGPQELLARELTRAARLRRSGPGTAVDGGAARRSAGGPSRPWAAPPARVRVGTRRSGRRGTSPRPL